MSAYDSVVNRIKQFLKGGSSTSNENSLKRRAQELPEISPLKYRRVSNAFPKVIRKPFEDERDFLHPRVVACMNISEKKSNEYPSYYKIPKVKPQFTNNHTYADVEYSDDEEDIIVSSPRNSSFGRNFGNNSTSNKIGKNSHFNASLPGQYPVLVRNKPALVNRSTSTINGNITEIPPSKFKLFGNRVSRYMKSADSQDTTWHKRLSASKSGNGSTKSIPGLIEAKTGRRLVSPCNNPCNNPCNYKPLRKSAWSNEFSQKYTNGFNNSDIDLTKRDSKMGNGIASNSPKRTTTTTESNTAENLSSSVVNRMLNVKQCQGYMNLLKKLAPALYKSDDSDEDRQTLARLAENRENSKRRTDSKRQPSKITGTISLIDDECEIQPKELIDLSNDDAQMVSACQKIQANKITYDQKRELPVVKPVNSLRDKFDVRPELQLGWLDKVKDLYAAKREIQRKQIAEEEQNVRKHSEETERQEKLVEERFRNFMIHSETILLDESESEEEEEFPELSDDQKMSVRKAVCRGPQDEVLVSKFNMNITRRDIMTLVGDAWLNDEVINFYMNLLMERGEERHAEGLPRVYAMNTFFVPRLLQSGHSAVRRWTRKVDIFSYDVIPVPVHVGQVHWCMAIIHLGNKTIKYYDSMGTPNPRLLNELEEYLKQESLDKRKTPFDSSKFVKESVSEAPRQMNGSDCGVFSCMFAEYITRQKNISFSQQQMQYFRQKMILEIIQGKLLL